MSEIERNLDHLAERINEEHRRCEAAVTSALEHALAAGDLLLEAKSACPHGAWQSWLESNFAGAVRTAQAYMRVSARRDEVEAAKTQSSAPLSLDGALRVLAEPPRPVLPAGALERYPFLKYYADEPEYLEKTVRRFDEMPEDRRVGFSREFVITTLVWWDYRAGRMLDTLFDEALEEYGLDLWQLASEDLHRPFAVLAKLFPERYEDAKRTIAERDELEAELGRLEDVVRPVDIPRGREHEALRSLLSEADMEVPLAELRRRGELDEPVRFPTPGSLEWLEHAFLASGYGPIED